MYVRRHSGRDVGLDFRFCVILIQMRPFCGVDSPLCCHDVNKTTRYRCDDRIRCGSRHTRSTATDAKLWTRFVRAGWLAACGVQVVVVDFASFLQPTPSLSSTSHNATRRQHTHTHTTFVLLPWAAFVLSFLVRTGTVLLPTASPSALSGATVHCPSASQLRIVYRKRPPWT